ncbi:Y-family DNA polymerase [Microbulbifer sp. CnH-101-G]|uniref:Y-family DNA polymerase n=1 Tax=Microbulbifer sp. CnH-101-G TaxID=3243393 RepID=UPI004039FA1D
MLWLCIRFPKLHLEALTRAQTPEERSQPLAIVEKQIIVETNKAAFECGVIPGLSNASARNLCPGLQILHRDREREQRQLEELAQWGLSFTPMVSVKAAELEHDNHHPRLYLKLDHCLKNHRGLRALLDQLRQELSQIGISHYLGLGHRPGTALLLSQLPMHRQWLQHASSPPTPQQWKQWINDTPCKLLECDNKILEKLDTHDFKWINQLLAAPISDLEAHFGRAFIDYLAQLNSNWQETVPCDLPELRFQKGLFFSKPLDTLRQLLLTCSGMLQELCDQLEWQEAYFLELQWQLIRVDGRATNITMEISSSHIEVRDLVTRIKLHFEQVNLEKPIQVLHLSYHRINSAPQAMLNCNCFESRNLHKTNDSQKLIDKLKARLGSQALSFSS